MDKAWFKSSLSRRGMIGMVKPLTWQGWAVQLGMVFIFALLAQGIGRWVFLDFKPLATGVWLIAGVFLLIGLYLRVVRRFSDASRNDQARND